jgi:hypothetical protein
MSLTASLTPSEQRTGELELLRGESRPLKTATGFVIAGLVCVLFWMLVYAACVTL